MEKTYYHLADNLIIYNDKYLWNEKAESIKWLQPIISINNNSQKASQIICPKPNNTLLYHDGKNAKYYDSNKNGIYLPNDSILYYNVLRNSNIVEGFDPHNLFIIKSINDSIDILNVEIEKLIKLYDELEEGVNNTIKSELILTDSIKSTKKIILSNIKDIRKSEKNIKNYDNIIKSLKNSMENIVHTEKSSLELKKILDDKIEVLEAEKAEFNRLILSNRRMIDDNKSSKKNIKEVYDIRERLKKSLIDQKLILQEKKDDISIMKSTIKDLELENDNINSDTDSDNEHFNNEHFNNINNNTNFAIVDINNKKWNLSSKWIPVCKRQNYIIEFLPKYLS